MIARQAALKLLVSKPGIPLIATLAVWLAAVPVAAQLSSQYTAPGQPTSLRPRPSKDEFKLKLESSPWKTGPLHLSPWLGLQDVSVVENLGAGGDTTGEDFTLTVGAGLRAYVPAGRKVIWAAHALPEYVWWQDTEAKRNLNGRYGLGLFVFFNRMTLEFSLRRIDQQNFFSSEIQSLTSSRQDLSTLGVEVELSRGLSLFGLATLRDQDSLETETAIFSALDREETTGVIGLRYESSWGWNVELSHEEFSNEFATDARPLSNSGSSEVAKIGVQRPKVELRLRIATNDLEGDEGSDFRVFDETTGRFDVLWQPSPKFGVLGYTRRDLAYSVSLGYADFLSQRQGARVSLSLGDSILGLYAETGEDEYTAVSSGFEPRLDDVTAYGAAFLVDLKELSFSVKASRTEYDSNLEGLDREITRLSFGIKLDAITRLTSELIDRLSLGTGGTGW